MADESDEFINVLETRDEGRVALAKSLLSGAGIEFMVCNVFPQDILGYGRIGYNPALGLMQVKVRAEDADAARHIIGDLAGERPRPYSRTVRLLVWVFLIIVPLVGFLAILISDMIR
ncbi:MAG: DUF2007 domain-containing protein [Armatimonadetes bacterium]|nr:DUF2007 domain-containing protein [Armatimonadota bacterium]